MTLALAGCSSDKWGFPYRAPVQQGNWITQEQVALLQPGMTREQVRYALGSPTLTSVLHADRWDYPYFYQPGFRKPQERRFTVWFENDRLVRWEGDTPPEVQPFQQEPSPAASRREEARSERDEARAKQDAPIAEGRRLEIQPVDATSRLPGAGNPEPLR
ncbi:outer membrane protein assembly factor BamE [Orrella sp. JC864]|uniref:outer membrane protein assembly factor BamE n=1 Tax=Orrella sp. JC864 TaxID=3120298 RepID=UPI0012BD7E96